MPIRKDQLNALGYRILNASRTELLLSMRYLASAFNALPYALDLSTKTIGTDAFSIRFNPSYLFVLYRENPSKLNRTYLHCLMHCLYRHMFHATRFSNPLLYDLACDIAVESVIDSIETQCVARISSDFRDALNARLTDALHVLTAERIYRYLEENPPGANDMALLLRNYILDDHSFWKRMPRNEDDAKKDTDADQNPPLPLFDANLRQVKKDEWDRTLRRVKSDLSLFSKETSAERGMLTWSIDLETEKRTFLAEYLRRFSVLREEAHVDPDSFDYGLYHYGMELYGNLPLIEVNETREAKKVEQLVIAIDTSASTRGDAVKRFLNETFSILRHQESFFHHVDLHILECDNEIRNETVITDLSRADSYASEISLHGGYGTDYTPVFSHIEALRKKGELRHLKGLLYFTDGYGTFPKRPTTYETAFVYEAYAANNADATPPWAVKVYLEEA